MHHRGTFHPKQALNFRADVTILFYVCYTNVLGGGSVLSEFVGARLWLC